MTMILLDLAIYQICYLTTYFYYIGTSFNILTIFHVKKQVLRQEIRFNFILIIFNIILYALVISTQRKTCCFFLASSKKLIVELVAIFLQQSSLCSVVRVFFVSSFFSSDNNCQSTAVNHPLSVF